MPHAHLGVHPYGYVHVPCTFCHSTRTLEEANSLLQPRCGCLHHSQHLSITPLHLIVQPMHTAAAHVLLRRRAQPAPCRASTPLSTTDESCQQHWRCRQPRHHTLPRWHWPRGQRLPVTDDLTTGAWFHTASNVDSAVTHVSINKLSSAHSTFAPKQRRLVACVDRATALTCRPRRKRQAVPVSGAQRAVRRESPGLNVKPQPAAPT